MKIIMYSFLLLSFFGCQNKATDKVDMNPASEVGKTDAKAAEIADAVMQAMGGQEKWDETKVLSWNFFGARQHFWDKSTGDVRIEFPADSSVYAFNLNTMEGKVWRQGNEIPVSDSLHRHYLKNAKSMWINDSYWLVMPFKLRDPGVNLAYVRDDKLKSGGSAQVLELTFNKVGDTPNNKYEVFVDQADNRIKQWAFYKNATDSLPAAIWPWDNYKNFDGLWLSGDRSDSKGPKDVKVYESLPRAVFESLEYNL